MARTRSKKELISEGALRAFAKYGYSDTTMDTIADVAQVAKGTLYYHFKTKEELFLYVNERGVDLLIGAVTDAMKDESRHVHERLMTVLDVHLRFFAEHQEFCTLLLSVSTGDRERDDVIRKILARYFATMEGFLADLQAAGIVRADLDVQTMASALFGMVGLTALRRLYRGEPVYDETGKATLAALCKGVLVQPPAPQSQDNERRGI